MCGRFNAKPVKANRRWAEILPERPTLPIEYRFNTPPTTNIAIITAQGWQVAKWGMVPRWAPEFKSKFSTINARIESVQELRTFKSAWRESRTCVVPAAGYYEWPEYLDKQPYYIHKPGDMLCFAGLWEPWKDGQISCTFLTEEPHGPLADLHDRMPVMLSPDMARCWLEEGTKINPSGSGVCFELEWYPVSKAVNNVRNEGPELIERIS
jgi:putative SOS response-associated peptidase YedK